MTTIVESQSASAEMIIGAVGVGAEVVPSVDALRHHLDDRPNEFAVVLGSSVNLDAAFKLAETLRITRPALSVILLRPRVESSVLAEALRSGLREVVEERDLTGLAAAVRRSHVLYRALTADRSGPLEDNKGKLITVFSAKGGVGKTTVSTNLAVALAAEGHRVCIVDLDLAFGDVAITMQLSPEHTIVDALDIEGDIGLEDLRPLLTSYSENLWALAGPSTPSPDETRVKAIVGKILTALKQGFDYTVVDTPPAFDEHVLQAFDESDLVLLVLTPDITALKNLKITSQMLGLLNYSEEKSRVILNRADSKVGVSEMDVSETLKAKIFASIPSSAQVPASTNKGEPIVVSSPRHPVSLAFSALARGCAGEDVVTAEGAAENADAKNEKRRMFHRKVRSA
jgi:pilus assembly protein CpaE